MINTLRTRSKSLLFISLALVLVFSSAIGTSAVNLRILEEDYVEWFVESFETAPPHREYERMYVNGQPTHVTRYTGRLRVPRYDWRIEGYETAPPYMEYERLYLDGHWTYQTRRTGKMLAPFHFTVIRENVHNLVSGVSISTGISSIDCQSVMFDVKLIHYFYDSSDGTVVEWESQSTGITCSNPIYVPLKYQTVTDLYTEHFINYPEYVYLGSVVYSYRENLLDYYGAVVKRNDWVINDKFYQEKFDTISTLNTRAKVAIYLNNKRVFHNILAQERAANRGVPLKIVEARVGNTIPYNPDAVITFRNLTSKPIASWGITIRTYDSNGRAVNRFLESHNMEWAYAPNILILPGGFQTVHSSLGFGDLTTRITVTVTSVVFTDGTVWSR